MHCTGIDFSGHALRRMFERAVTVSEVQTAIEFGETVAIYPDDLPYPSSLILGVVAGRPLHVVVGRDPTTGACYVITAYEPASDLWEAGFKTRKTT